MWPLSESPLPLQLAMGKMMEQGPVLIITFQAQLVMVIKNPKGEVVEGDPVSAGGSRAGPWPGGWLPSAPSLFVTAATAGPGLEKSRALVGPGGGRRVTELSAQAES